MPITHLQNTMETYRPPQACLDIFWTLTEGNDEERVEAAIQLVKMIQSVEKKSEREELSTYCVNRLVRGLGSGRKFARVGFSTALTLMLRLQTELKISQVLKCFHEKLKSERTASSKSEKAALYLGRAFALSSIIQSGRASQLTDEMLGPVVDELLLLSNKRSFLKPVASKTLQLLIMEISEKSFCDVVWPKIREHLVSAWQGCTLDRIGLLLVCKDRFPNVVNKKFIKKHWGSSIFAEENDEKLLQALQLSSEKASAMKELLPSIVAGGREALSIWKGLGEKMYLSGKGVLGQHQLIALDLLDHLVKLTTTSQQISSLILDPSVTKIIFMDNYSNNKALGTLLNSLVGSVHDKLGSLGGNVLEFVKKVLRLEGSVEDQDSKDGKLSFVHTSSFNKIITLMKKEDTEEYAQILVDIIKGKDNVDFLSDSGKKRNKQLDWCFRQLQHITCSQDHTTAAMQSNVLSLFLRNGFFNGTKKNDSILHCDYIDKLVETKAVKELCEQFFFKSLNQLCTMNFDHSSKSESFATFTKLLSNLAHYFDSLIKSDDVTKELSWSDEVLDIWKQLIKRISSIEKGKTQCSSAFGLLYLYMAVHLLTDVKAATDLLKDIFICQDKSSDKKAKKSKQEQEEDEEEEPHWTEVLTEILLQLLSLPSHLGRVIVSHVFELMVPDITMESVAIVTQVLSPNSQSNVTFEETEDGDEGVEEEENGMLIDEDVPSEASSDEDDNGSEDEKADDDGEDEEDDDDGEEEKEDTMDVDEQFRASLRQALGNAAVDTDGSDSEDDLPDMTDAEMFKMDKALAEVFRQRKQKYGGKKAREQKRKEIGNFRLRALDLVDVLIKSNRCGDFLFELLKPLLVLMFTSTREEEQAACKRAKASFHSLRSHCKGLSMSSKPKEEQLNLFQELIDLAKKVTDSSQLQQIAWACVLLIKVCTAGCMKLLQDTLSEVVYKGQSKPQPPFFIHLMHTDPAMFKPLCAMLIDCLKNEASKRQCKTMACTLLTSLVKESKRETSESNVEDDASWMTSTAKVISPLLFGVMKDKPKGMLMKELLALTLALLGRKDVINIKLFENIKDIKLMKGKMGTDSRRLTNKILAAVDSLSKTVGSEPLSKKQKKKKKGNKKPGKEEEQIEVEKATEEVEKATGEVEKATGEVEKKSSKKKRKAAVLDEEENESDLEANNSPAKSKSKKKKRKLNDSNSD